MTQKVCYLPLIYFDNTLTVNLVKQCVGNGPICWEQENKKIVWQFVTQDDCVFIPGKFFWIHELSQEIMVDDL